MSNNTRTNESSDSLVDVGRSCETLVKSDAIERRAQRLRARGEPPRLKTQKVGPGVIAFDVPESDARATDAKWAAAFGATDVKVARRWLGLLYAAVNPADLREHEERTNYVLSAMHGLEPINEADAMAAAQMLACFEGSLESFRMANQADTGEQRSRHMSEAQKLMKTYAQLAEVRMKIQGKTGQQTVKVEHVHVNEGGQAIVGSV